MNGSFILLIPRITVMLSLTFIFFSLTYCLSSSEIISVYSNARFDPIDIRFKLANLSSIESLDICTCKCYNDPMCLTANYIGMNNNCLLYFAQLWQGQLKLLTQNQNATVIYFEYKEISGKYCFMKFIFSSVLREDSFRSRCRLELFYKSFHSLFSF